jgi:diguanylate cyclase (GGDEF)-like protein
VVGDNVRERVFLFGDTAGRPKGLERALVRAGFLLTEGAGTAPVKLPDLAVVSVPDAGSDLERALATFTSETWAGVPVIVLLASGARDGVARSLALGAADALAAPIDLGELNARLEARLRNRAEARRGGGAGTLQTELFLAIQEVAASHRPEDMLDTLVRRLGEALGAAHCACLVPSSDRRHARLLSAHESPTLRDTAVDLARYPEAVEAAVAGRTVHAPEVLRHPLFLAHLARWPDSPEVHEIESAAAVPLITQRTVRAIMVIRTRRGEPALTREQVTLVEQLANATAALLEREDRRAGAARRQGLVATTDPLTGCANLDALDRRLRDEFERVQRYGTELALALLDVDALRELNRRLGTEAGDRFLVELGMLLQQELRTPDFVARYGGDKFALLLPATSLEGARQVLARIAERMHRYPFTRLTPAERPKLVAGLVVFPHPGVVRVEDLLTLAGAALLRGKTGDNGGVGIAA